MNPVLIVIGVMYTVGVVVPCAILITMLVKHWRSYYQWARDERTRLDQLEKESKKDENT